MFRSGHVFSHARVGGTGPPRTVGFVECVWGNHSRIRKGVAFSLPRPLPRRIELTNRRENLGEAGLVLLRGFRLGWRGHPCCLKREKTMGSVHELVRGSVRVSSLAGR